MQTSTFTNFDELSYAVKESFNTLYTNLTFCGSDIKKVMLTSCHPSDGKTFISMQLARTIANMGKKVVVVDLDLRKSILLRDYMSIGEGTGLGSSHYLAGMATIDEVLYSTEVANMFVVPCTKFVSASLSLFDTPRLKTLMDTLAEQMDYVIVDSPPVGMLIDAAKVATVCDGMLMVMSYNSTSYREVIDAQAQLEQSGCPILGAVINQADYSDYVGRKYGGGKYYSKYYNSYYYYNYGYGYGPEQSDGKKGKRRKGKRRKDDRNQ